MSFVYAFLVGGALCAFFQLILSLMKLGVAEMLILCIALGAALAPTGIIAWLETVGGAGMSIMVFDAGNMLLGAFMSLYQGDPSVIVLTVIVFTAVLFIGVFAGMLREAHLARKEG